MTTEQIDLSEYVSLFNLLEGYSEKCNLSLKESASNLYGLATRHNFPIYTHFRLSKKLFPEIVSRNWMRFELNRDLSQVIQYGDFRYRDKEKLYRTSNYDNCGFHSKEIWDFLKISGENFNDNKNDLAIDWNLEFEKLDENLIREIIEFVRSNSQGGEFNKVFIDPNLIPLHYSELFLIVLEIQRENFPTLNSRPNSEILVEEIMEKYKFSKNLAETLERIACPVDRTPTKGVRRRP